jgi:prepilin-type N-terminal cleavage/methylation domain-containing protein
MVSPRRGFTLLELLIVVAIIAILAGLILWSLSALKKSKDRAVTMSFMEQLGESLNHYLDEWPRLGDDQGNQYSDDFRKSPWRYIGERQVRAKKVPFVDVKLAQLVKVTGVGTCEPAKTKYEATHIVDAYGTSPTNVLSWAIVDSSLPSAGPPYRYTKSIDLRSSAGTAKDIKDDIVYHWDNSTRAWTFVKATTPWDDESGQHNAPLPGVPTAE